MKNPSVENYTPPKPINQLTLVFEWCYHLAEMWNFRKFPIWKDLATTNQTRQLDPLQLYERSREREVRRGDEIRRNVINFLRSELGNVGLKVEPEYKRSVYKVGDNVRFLLKASAEADPYKDHERYFFGVMPEIYFEKLFFAGEDNRPEYRFALFACVYTV